MIFFKKEINNFSTIALHQDCQYNIYYSKSEGIIAIVCDLKKNIITVLINAKLKFINCTDVDNIWNTNVKGALQSLTCMILWRNLLHMLITSNVVTCVWEIQFDFHILVAKSGAYQAEPPFLRHSMLILHNTYDDDDVEFGWVFIKAGTYVLFYYNLFKQ